MPSWAINSTNLSNYIKLNKMEERKIMEFYNTFRTQFELLPRFTIIYGKDTLNGFAIEWLWFGVFVQFFN